MGDTGYEFAIRISDDYYKAFFSMDMLDNSINLKPEEIIKALKEKNVTYGLKFNVIENIAKQRHSVRDILVAEGHVHEHGEDAVIELLVDDDKKVKPQILDDGRVDFKNMGYVEIVKKDDVLAVKKPPTKAKNGMTVTGKTIKGKDGKDIVFKIGKNVHVTQDGLKVLADADGTISVVDQKIAIEQMLDIRSDIGVETGNIFFHGQVNVNGNVTTGYVIECDGDVIVNGIVEGATIKSKGNIIISRGIQGMEQALIECNGNLTTNFINSATVNVKGNVETGAVMSSQITCDGAILVKGKKGLIIGGEITSKGDIMAKTIGSELGIITQIKLGVDVEIIEELKALSIEVKETMEMHDKLDKSLKILKKKVEKNPNDSDAFSLFRKYSKSFIALDTELTEKRQRLKMLNELINNIRGSRLTANTIFPGTRVKIGNSSFYVKNVLKNTILLKDKGEIVTQMI